jgi:long-chain acyl-CoA synthetase
MKELIYSRTFLEQCRRYADKVALIDGDYRASYAQHLDRVLRLCGALQGLGVARTDRVVVFARNCHEFVELYHAAFLGAAIINPLNTQLTAKELEYIVRDSGAWVCIADAEFAPVIARIREAAGIQQVVWIGEIDCQAPQDSRYEGLIEQAQPLLPEEPEEDEPVLLMYTGGTTGLPKGVLSDQRAQALNLYHAAHIRSFGTDTRYLVCTPMFHVTGLSATLVIPHNGATFVLTRTLDASHVHDLIAEHEITMTLMGPTAISTMLAADSFAPSKLRTLRSLIYGAAPMPRATQQLLMSQLPELDLYQVYGMTEASAVLTMLSPADHRQGGRLLGSAGRAAYGVSLSIQKDGRILEPGEIGEVCARGGNYMREYWNRPEQTAEAFAGGWYHTGDAGYLDEQGYVYLVDRIKDMMVVRSANVYSVEVENALASHAAVAQVAVFGIPDARTGEAVHAVIVTRPGSHVSAAELTEHAAISVASYKLPTSFDFRSEPLPLSGALKIPKRELRARYWAGHERAI